MVHGEINQSNSGSMKDFQKEVKDKAESILNACGNKRDEIGQQYGKMEGPKAEKLWNNLRSAVKSEKKTPGTGK